MLLSRFRLFTTIALLLRCPLCLLSLLFWDILSFLVHGCNIVPELSEAVTGEGCFFISLCVYVLQVNSFLFVTKDSSSTVNSQGGQHWLGTVKWVGGCVAVTVTKKKLLFHSQSCGFYSVINESAQHGGGVCIRTKLPSLWLAFKSDRKGRRDVSVGKVLATEA